MNGLDLKTADGKMALYLFQSFIRFLKIVGRESPRGLIIVGASMVEESLKLLLEKNMIPIMGEKRRKQLIDDYNGPIGTFSNRQKLAYLLGLIGKDVYDDIDLIRGIRNACAHDFNQVNLNGDPIRQKINSLRSAKVLFDILDVEKLGKTRFHDFEPRIKLILNIGSLCTLLGAFRDDSSQPEEKKSSSSYIADLLSGIPNTRETDPESKREVRSVFDFVSEKIKTGEFKSIVKHKNDFLE